MGIRIGFKSRHSPSKEGPLTCVDRSGALPCPGPWSNRGQTGGMTASGLTVGSQAMASIRTRARKDGTATYEVRWKQGGRAGSWEYEKFGDPGQASAFKGLVDAHGQQWPVGWVPGKGYVDEEDEEPAHPDDVPWLDWCRRYVDRLTGIDERTRTDYRREIDRHLSLMRHTTLAGRVLPATAATITADDVQDWVRAEEAGEAHPEDPERWLRKPAAPKSIRNRHGLLWCIVQAAVKAGLREENCCQDTTLPRSDDQTDEEMVFLEAAEYQAIASRITDPRARDLTDWLVGTGMRYGEATALQTQDFNERDRTIKIARAWKKGGDGEFYLGPPKTKKSRRTITLTADQVSTLQRLTLCRVRGQLVFRTAQDCRWRHANFYNRKWKPAVSAALSAGQLAQRPRIHDLRHTHVAWLIAGRVPLPAIQARLGHESIQTTVDRYGHLLREVSDQVDAAVAAAMTAATRPSMDLTA